jgi:hypothetical protein
VSVFAALAGAKGYRGIGDRAGGLPAVLLQAAGARRHPRTGTLRAPSGSTIRRVVQSTDADAADLLVCRWLADAPPGRPPPGQRKKPATRTRCSASRWTARRCAAPARATRTRT